MKILKKKIDIEKFHFAPFNHYFQEYSGAILDIETTGLFKHDAIILVGLIIIEKSEPKYSIQLFAENTDDEKKILEKTSKILNDLDYVITYNGASFDMPFIVNKAKKYKVKINTTLYNFDLFNLIRSCSPIREFLPNLKQKTIETYLGINDCRQDQISGKQSADNYTKYLKTKEVVLENEILLHNYDDILQLYRCLNIIKKSDIHQYIYKYGFPTARYTVHNIDIHKKTLIAQGEINSIDFQIYDDEYKLKFRVKDNKFKLIQELTQLTNLMQDATKIDKILFLDLNEYYFNIDEYNDKNLYNGCLLLQSDEEVNYATANKLTKNIIQFIIDRYNI
ncbi:MAG: ribonuclease H-like domain-containing protein [Eubacteriales bacterium]|nr:ribonuclease H-like domain-containing protein [Eubacteriales bacterium]MDY3332795.1 ribonuclease H-like domain-containing protein [Gallibacter sp.]